MAQTRTPKAQLDATLVDTTSSQTITGKTISGASNTISNISLTAEVTGVLPIANGGTNSATQNFVDLTTAQSAIAGIKKFTSEQQSSGGYRVYSDGSIGITLDGSLLVGAPGTWALKQGSDGTFLFDQTGSLNARFKLGGTSSSNTIDFTPDYSNSYFKVTGAKAVTTANNTLDSGGTTGNMTVTGSITAGGIAVDTISGTQTLTNKRVTKRVLALSANSATPAINTDSYDVVHITAQTAAITSFTSGLTGTPVDGDTLRISITGTAAVAITWGTSFESSTVTLPTTTVTTARLDVGFFWNTETSKWRCVAMG